MVGLKVPQDAAGVQLQVTPLAPESFDTVADTLAVPPKIIVAVGAVAKATEIGCLPPPDEPPLLQPVRHTNTTIVRMSGRLMATPPENVCIPC
ncbi:MAG: hypothetical protein WBL63_18880 [Candidatus Acidiferrum sp.]